MKRLFALVLSAVMLLGCSAAAADRVVTSEFEDFTLQTTVPLDYSSFKVVGQPLFVYYRTVTGEVSTSAVSAIWLPSVEPVTADEFTAMLREAEPAMRSQQETKGNTLKSYEVSEAAETELWGVPVLVCDVDAGRPHQFQHYRLPAQHPDHRHLRHLHLLPVRLLPEIPGGSHR